MRKPPNIGKYFFNNDGSSNNINLFDAQQYFVNTNNVNLNPSNFVQFQVSPGTAERDYVVTDVVVATAKIERSDPFTSNATDITSATGAPEAGKFEAGTFTITSNSINADVTLEAGDTLADVEAKLIEAGKTVNLDAYVIFAGSNYYLVMQGATPGLTLDYTISDPSGVLANVNFTTTQPASDATATINGIAVTSGDNVIENFVNGVTITLLRDMTPGDEITADVEIDTEPAFEGIKLLVENINEVLKFDGKQMERGDNGLLVETAVLGNEAEYRALMNEFNLIIDGVYTGLSGNNTYSSWYEIGAKKYRHEHLESDDIVDGTYLITMDDQLLLEKLTDEFSNVRNIFEFQQQSSSSKLMITKSTNFFSGGTMDFVIDDTQSSDLDKALVTIDSVAYQTKYIASSNGARIVGIEGTPIYGMEFNYIGDGSDSVSITMAQGFADRMYRFIDGVVSSSTNYDASGTSFSSESFF